MIPPLIDQLISRKGTEERLASFSRTARRHQPLLRGLALLGFYFVWIVITRLLVLTFVTYFVLSSSKAGRPQFEEVSEAFAANETGIAAIGAILFILFFRALNPLASGKLSSLTLRSPMAEQIEKRFIPGFAQGAIVASGVALAFVIADLYQYVGFFVQFEETPVALANMLLRALNLMLLVFAEEYLFRGVFLDKLRIWRDSLSRDHRKTWKTELLLATLLSIAYCAVKTFQFDLSAMQIITLFLVSMLLTIRCTGGTAFDFVRGAGFWAALLVIFHAVLSLPIFGNEVTGIILLKYQSAESHGELIRLLSGGIGGPLGSFAIQFLLLVELTRELLRSWRKKIPN